MKKNTQHTAEHVGDGHPDKFCDQVADRILDETLRLCEGHGDSLASARTAIECLAKDRVLFVSGETKWPEHHTKKINVSKINIAALAREVWLEIGYSDDGDDLTVVDHVQGQSLDIAGGVNPGGAGDQGIMVGYATDETNRAGMRKEWRDVMMPVEWLYAREICERLRDLRRSGKLKWLKPDTKSQVTVDPDGKPISYIVAAQTDIFKGYKDPKNPKKVLRDCGITHNEMRELIFNHAVKPVLGDHIKLDLKKINGTGAFVTGGPTGDSGVVGRKIVVDAYGPRVAVGGGAYSGKDPTKVDRSAAYMARQIAKTIVKVHGVKEALVHIAYGIGQKQPEMVTAITDSGQDLSKWVRAKGNFPDLSPGHIIERLGLRKPKGWSYFETASYGHYGRSQFPWEKIADVK